MQDLSDFEKLYQQSNQDFGIFIEICKTLETAENPEQKLKDLIK
jgi:hypothetical protein